MQSRGHSDKTSTLRFNCDGVVCVCHSMSIQLCVRRLRPLDLRETVNSEMSHRRIAVAAHAMAMMTTMCAEKYEKRARSYIHIDMHTALLFAIA